MTGCVVGRARAVALLAAVAVAGRGQAAGQAPPAASQILQVAEPRAPDQAPPAAEQRAAQAIGVPALRAHVRFLAHDLLEGRLPGSRGGRLAEAYLAAQLEALGLEPGAPGGGWFQEVPLVGVTSRATGPMRLVAGGQTLALAFGEEMMAHAGAQRERTAWRDAEVVFVGYGITAPEFAWDDFKGLDVRGKVLLVMNNDPEDDPALFAGTTRLYYGRWTYKYEEAARRGAAGVIIIHTTPSAAYPWQVVRTSFAGQKFELPAAGEPTLEVRAWATEEASRRIAALGGRDLDVLRAAAQKRDFRPVPLGVRVSLELENTLTRTSSANVVGRLPGGDPRRSAEAIIYTAHHDHLGMIPGAVAGTDAIYNGAVDNATGVAALLEIARAFAALPERPARTVLFAAVTAEEQGTLGSEWLARHPPVPAGRLAAVLNMDAMNVLGRTRDVTLVGMGKCSLDGDVAALAAWQGRVVKAETHPDQGTYYRSDHFSFAKVGVPGAYVGAGLEYLGRPAGWGDAQVQAWIRAHYHQPSDEWRDEYDLSGMVEDTRLLFHLGARVAGAAAMPTWRPGDEFEPARRRAIAAAE
jgi:Zn-dependent M28 family amino/carboxypeptidase